MILIALKLNLQIDGAVHSLHALPVSGSEGEMKLLLIILFTYDEYSFQDWVCQQYFSYYILAIHLCICVQLLTKNILFQATLVAPAALINLRYGQMHKQNNN